MKYLALVLLFLFITSSCRTPEPPQIDVVLTYNSSDRWETAITNLFTVFFTNGPSSGGNLNVQGSEVIHDLENRASQLAYETEYSAQIYHGLKPGIDELLLVDLVGDTVNVMIPYIESLVLAELFETFEDEAYTIEFIVDLDSAISGINGAFSLDLAQTEVLFSRN